MLLQGLQNPPHAAAIDTMALNKSLNKFKGKERQNDCAMDVDLWGDLQKYIPLEMVYEKLPLQSFFLLREVCKSWNSIACERRGFKDLIPRPYFVLMPFSWSKPKLLAYNISRGEWIWKRIVERKTPLKPPVPAFSLHGMLYSSDRYRFPARELQLYVMDTHVSKEYLLPTLPALEQEVSWDGMVVDTTVTPHTFKIIRGDVDFGTQIYDSTTDSWSSNLAKPSCRRPPHLTTCVDFNNSLYIRSVAPDIITVYDLQKAVWSRLNPPEQLPDARTYGGSLGTWQGRLFTVTEHHDGVSFDSISVCELQTSSLEWREYLRMPSNLYNRWFSCEDDKIWSSFCGEYVLMIAWLHRSCEFDQPKHMCLCSLATRTWEMFDAPHDIVGGRVEVSDDF